MDTGEKDEHNIDHIRFYLLIAVVVCVAYNTARCLYGYTKVITIARKVKGLPGTGFIHGDCWYDSYADYLDGINTFIQVTGVNILKVWIYFFYPVYVLNHADTIKQVLCEFHRKSAGCLNGCVSPRSMIGKSLLTVNDKRQWKRRRRFVSRAFSLDHIKNYIGTFNECAEELLIRLSKVRRHTSVEISETVSVATLDALLRCAFSYDGDLQEQGFNHFYVQAVQRLASLHKQRMRNPILSYDFIYHRTLRGKQFLSLCDFIHGFTENMLVRRIELMFKQFENGEISSQKSDMLDALLTAGDGSKFSYMDVREEIEAFVFKGHYSLSSALTSALYCLSIDPQIQTKVYEEIDAVIGDGEVEWEHLCKLQYLHCFIQEVLRIHTVVPLVERTLDKPLEVGGIRLEPGSLVQLNMHSSNNNGVWENYKEFKPERFQVSTAFDDLGCSPFSTGPRKCLGQDFTMIKLKVIISRILQTFHLELDKTCKVMPTHVLGCKAINGFKVFLLSR